MANRVSFAKIVTILAVAFGIGLGLCGLSAILPSSGEEFHTNWLSSPSLLIMVLSFLGLVVTLLIWIIASAIRGFSAKSSDPQTLLGNSDEDSNDRGKSS